MNAHYIDFTNKIDESILNKIGQDMKNGKLVVFPTETVYGIGTNGLDQNATKLIYEAKGRPSDNPLILHISDYSMLSKITCNISNVEKKLIDNFFPGPFTIILNKSSIVPYSVTANLETVAVRMPSNEIAKKLIFYAGVPIAAPSANVSGKPSGTTVSDILNELGNKVDYIIDGGMCEIGLESTVVRVINGVPTILRPGKITKEQIYALIGKVEVDSHVFEKCEFTEKVLSPGMKHKHYAPKAKCLLVYSDNNDSLVSKINELSRNNNVLVISSSENIDNYHSKYILDIGSKNNLSEISHNIFSALRKVDSYDIDFVIIEGVKKDGIGLAIMNRLIRACDYNYIEC